MQKDTVTKFKWFWAWQDDKEEEWLAEMAAQGLHLDGFAFPTLYRLRVGEPAEYVYRLDYPGVTRKDRESYLQLFADAGWELAGEMSGWMYFRRRVQPGDPTEIFTDLESKVQKYSRVMLFLMIFFVMWIVIRPDFEPENMGLLQNIILGLYTCFMLFWGYAIFKLGQRIKQLRDAGKAD